MVDPHLIKRFKQISREDHQIAEIIARLIDMTTIGSLLEIGAGPGTISRNLAVGARPDCRVAVVEPHADYRPSYLPEATVYESIWEEARIEASFDLALMSHVMGHFLPEHRNGLVAKAADILNTAGALAIVTNGPAEPFWTLNLAIGESQGMQYVIDFDSLERTLSEQFPRVARVDEITPLELGNSEAEYVNLMNTFFPKPFSAAEREQVMDLAPRLRQGQHFVLHMSQRIYLASRSAQPANWRVEPAAFL